MTRYPDRERWLTIIANQVMQFAIQVRGFNLRLALRQHAERCLRFVLARVGKVIRKISVRLSDVNGPRGGADEQCHLHVGLNHLSVVVIEDIEGDLYPAIDRAAAYRRAQWERSGNRSRLGQIKLLCQPNRRHANQPAPSDPPDPDRGDHRPFSSRRTRQQSGVAERLPAAGDDTAVQRARFRRRGCPETAPPRLDDYAARLLRPVVS
jgi:ribosome-associated translation inhibitor RaiA